MDERKSDRETKWLNKFHWTRHNRVYLIFLELPSPGPGEWPARAEKAARSALGLMFEWNLQKHIAYLHRWSAVEMEKINDYVNIFT